MRVPKGWSAIRCDPLRSNVSTKRGFFKRVACLIRFCGSMKAKLELGTGSLAAVLRNRCSQASSPGNITRQSHAILHRRDVTLGHSSRVCVGTCACVCFHGGTRSRNGTRVPVYVCAAMRVCARVRAETHIQKCGSNGRCCVNSPRRSELAV